MQKRGGFREQRWQEKPSSNRIPSSSSKMEPAAAAAVEDVTSGINLLDIADKNVHSSVPLPQLQFGGIGTINKIPAHNQKVVWKQKSYGKVSGPAAVEVENAPTNQASAEVQTNGVNKPINGQKNAALSNVFRGNLLENFTVGKSTFSQAQVRATFYPKFENEKSDQENTDDRDGDQRFGHSGGAFMVAPMVNPYEPSMTKQERNRMWKKWAMRKKFMYILAHKFPRLLPFFYRRAFLSGIHGPIDERLSLSLGTRRKLPYRVSNWEFSLADLKVHRKPLGKGILKWLKSLYGQAEESLSGFLGPIHIWLGMEDMVVPPSTSVFLQRVLPDAMVHKLLYEGHFTYFYFCNECHRQIFTTIFGDPQGPLIPEVVQFPINEETPINEDDKETDNIVSGEIATDAEIVSNPV
nr:hydrolase, alpha/beta fold family protein [Ipomoea batatas]